MSARTNIIVNHAIKKFIIIFHIYHLLPTLTNYVVTAIEIANQRRWRNLWIETDSALVVMAFKNATLIPCNLRNRWYNCKLLLNAMNFIVSHIYREGNQCADRLAALGLTIQNLTIWSDVPLDIREFYVKNRLGMPNFRFINF